MVAGKLPEWLPSGFTEKFKYKNGRRTKYYYNAATGAKYFSKKEVLSCATSDNGPLATPQTPNGDDNVLSSDSKVDAELDKTNDSPNWLPDGWTTEERTRNSGPRRGSVYKVFDEVSSGKRFYSKAAVTQYLGTVDCADTMIVQTKSDDDVEQQPHMSPQCLSMTNISVTPEEENKDNPVKTLDKADEPSPKCVLLTSIGGVIPEKENKNSFVKMLDKADEPYPKCLLMTNTSGIIPEEENKDDFKTLAKVDEPSPKGLSMTNTGGIPEVENKDSSIKMLDKVDEPSPKCISSIKRDGTPEEEGKNDTVKTFDKLDDPSPRLSIRSSGAISGEKKKGTSFKPVAVVSSAAEDLPPGWTKEIVTSKYGIKTRKDPYYTDPVSGYVFRSKLDALRFVNTNDILSCAIRPKKRELTDLDFFKNKILSPKPAHEKLPEQLFVGAESNGCEAKSESEAKILNETISNNADSNTVNVTENNQSTTGEAKSESEAKILNQTISNNNDSNTVNVTENNQSSTGEAKSESEAKILNQTISNNTDSNTVNVTENNPENGASKDEPTVSMDVDAAISSPPMPEKTLAKPKNPRKRKTPSVPSRTSKRTSRNEPHTQPDSILSECPLEAAAKTEIEPLNKLDVAEPANEALSEHVFAEKGTPKEIEEQPKEVEINPPNDENPLVIPEEEQIFSVNINNDDESKQESSQLCFDFGDTWSVPLDFALKTLRGEIPIDDTLAAFPGCYNENLTIPYNNNNNPLDGCVRPSQSDVADIFRNEVDGLPKQQQSSVDPLTGSSSTPFSPLGNFGFMGYNLFNNHPSGDVGKNDGQTKFNP